MNSIIRITKVLRIFLINRVKCAYVCVLESSSVQLTQLIIIIIDR